MGGRLAESEERSIFNEGFALDEGKETLGVTPLDAEPDVILKMPEDSWLPLTLSIALIPLFGGLLVHSPVTAEIGTVAALVILGMWFAPQPETRNERIGARIG